MTARHPSEGGAGQLDAAQRASLYEAGFDWAQAIDLEIQSIGPLASIWDESARRGLLRIASAHDFEGTPDLAVLREKIEEAFAAGATVAKLAFKINQPTDLQRIIELMIEDHPLPVAVMGMGPLAPSSRLLAAQLGSVLNYGYLGSEPTAPGQWAAPQLKRVLRASFSS
jgi:3-dehydroquinate dehydratase-1